MRALLLMCALFAVACHDGGLSVVGGVDCTNPTLGCGGNVVGTWSFAQFCGDPVALVCAEASVTSSGMTLLTFNADMTYYVNEATFVSTVRYPPSCFTADAGLSGITCSAMTVGSQPCEGGGAQDCVCVGNNISFMGAQGNYATKNGTISITANTMNAMGTPVQYCVVGDSMTIGAPVQGSSPVVSIYHRN
jgi:hypothetical protein